MPSSNGINLPEFGLIETSFSQRSTTCNVLQIVMLCTLLHEYVNKMVNIHRHSGSFIAVHDMYKYIYIYI